MIIHCEVTKNKKDNKLIFKNNMFLLNDKTYTSLNHVLQDITKSFNLIIDTSVINNTTTEELWEFLVAIVEKAELEFEDVYIESNHTRRIHSEEDLETAKSPLSISVKSSFKVC